MAVFLNATVQADRQVHQEQRELSEVESIEPQKAISSFEAVMAGFVHNVISHVYFLANPLTVIVPTTVQNIFFF